MHRTGTNGARGESLRMESTGQEFPVCGIAGNTERNVDSDEPFYQNRDATGDAHAGNDWPD